MRFKLIASALAACVATGPALAQDIQMSPEQAEELACISEWLAKHKMDVAVADVYARGDQEGDAFDKVSAAMDGAMVGCRDQHDWTDEQTNIAAEVGMFQLILEVNSYRLSKSPGVTDAAFQQLGNVLTAMPEEDQRALWEGEWRDDSDVLKRMTDRLIAAGLPKESTILAYAMLIMEAKLVVTYGTMDWVKLTP